MRQAGNYYLPIARFAKGNNSIFIFKLKIRHCIFPLFNMAINLINVVAFDLMLWSREPTHYLVLWAPTGNTMYMHKLHHGNTCM